MSWREKLIFRARDDYFTVRAVQLAFAPRGVPHPYANLSDAPAHQLIIRTPAGFERYFARMAAERRGTEPPEWAKPRYALIHPAVTAGCGSVERIGWARALGPAAWPRAW